MDACLRSQKAAQRFGTIGNIIETKPTCIRMKERVLTLDIGNTAAKVSVFEGERLLECHSSGTLSEQDIECMVLRHVPECAVSCRVGEDSRGLEDFLERGFGNRYLRLCPSTGGGGWCVVQCAGAGGGRRNSCHGGSCGRRTLSRR